MGHLISRDGIKPTQSRIQSVQDTPPPKNKQELQSFLGKVSYNACKVYVSLISHITSPLPSQKKNTKWVWETEHQKAFQHNSQIVAVSGEYAGIL